MSAYHLDETFGEKVPVKWYWYFFGTVNRDGIGLYHLQNTSKFFTFSRHETWHWQSKQMVHNISVFSVRRGKM